MPKYFKIEDIKAKDLMSTDIVTAECTEPLSELLGRMKKEDVYELPVLERGKLVGMVSYDVLLKRRQFPLTLEARSIMVSPPAVSENDSVAHIAEALLSSDMRAVPVTHKSKVVGMVSRGDVIRNLVELKEMAALKVSDIMTPSPVVVGERDDLEKARQAMKSLEQRSVPVVDEYGKLAGVIGARDIVNLTESQKGKSDGRPLGHRVDLKITVGSVMASPAVSLPPDATVAQALREMMDKDVSTVVITERERPAGVVTQADVLEYITSLKEREGLYLNITGLDDQDPDTYDGIYSIVEKSMKRIASIAPPQTLTMHFGRYSRESDTSKHTISVRLQTRKGLFLATSFGWDIFAAVDESMRKLETQIKREHERTKEKPHKKGIVD
jgi:CBS domain-containing protein/ribosome-associated translation inhibitor RaiA